MPHKNIESTHQFKILEKISSKQWSEITKTGQAFFIYSENKIHQQKHYLKDFFQNFQNIKKKFSIYYSAKSNPNFYLINIVKDLVDGFDVSSSDELELLINMGVSPSKITFSGPGKTEESLTKAIQYQIKCLHLDSEDEYNAILKIQSSNEFIAHTIQRSIPVSLRIEGSQVESKKLGFSLNEAKTFLEKSPSLTLQGLHCYIGRESFTQSLFDETINQIQKIITEFKSHFIKAPTLFIGPGLPIHSDRQMKDNAKNEVFLVQQENNSDLVLEIGRALIGPCGFYGAKVLERKQTNQKREVVILEGGLQHLGSPIQSFRDHSKKWNPMVVRNQQILNNSLNTSNKESKLINMTIYGSLCLWHDALVVHALLPHDLKRGDWLIFSDCGAYGLTAGAVHFINQRLPTEWLLSTQGHLTDITNKLYKNYLDAACGGL